MKSVTFCFLLCVQVGLLQANSPNVDLPSFLDSISALRFKLVDLLGTFGGRTAPISNAGDKASNDPSVHDLVQDSVFADKQRNQTKKHNMFDNMKAMPVNLGGEKAAKKRHESYDNYEDYIDYEEDESIQEVCECATNHKILDATNSRIVGGTMQCFTI